MAYFARIENNVVVETLEAGELPEFHPSLIWVASNSAVGEGWLWDGNSFTDPETTKTVQEAKDEKLAELKSYRDNLFESGIDYELNSETNNFQINLEAQSNMQAVMLQFALGNTNPHNGSWWNSENVPIAMTDVEVQAFIQSVFTHVFLIKQTRWGHDAAIKALNAKQDVIDYDFTVGWP